MDLLARIDHIVSTHHARIHTELPALDRALQGQPLGGSALWREFTSLLRTHLAMEEQVLFPMIRTLCEDGVVDPMGLAGPVRHLDFEHARVTALESELRACLEDAGPHAAPLGALLDDLEVHAKLESELFPAALERAEAIGRG